jgi:hypothetical protein
MFKRLPLTAFLFLSLGLFSFLMLEKLKDQASPINQTPNLSTSTPINLGLDSRKTDTLLYFSADWCAICQETKNQIKERRVQGSNDLTIILVDLDRDISLTQTYSVRNPDTWIRLDPSGQLIGRWSSSSLTKVLEP